MTAHAPGCACATCTTSRARATRDLLLAQALSLPWTEPSLSVLVRRFNHAYRVAARAGKRDSAIDAGMGAVNEVIERPMTYREFLRRLR